MKRYIKEKCDNTIMKRIIYIIMLLFCTLSVHADINETSLGNAQVSPDNALFIDFSKDATMYLFVTLFILLLLSFIVIIHPINSLLLLFVSIILMANGFNLLLSFILMLISIVLITLSKKK